MLFFVGGDGEGGEVGEAILVCCSTVLKISS